MKNYGRIVIRKERREKGVQNRVTRKGIFSKRVNGLQYYRRYINSDTPSICIDDVNIIYHQKAWKLSFSPQPATMATDHLLPFHLYFRRGEKRHRLTYPRKHLKGERLPHIFEKSFRSFNALSLTGRDKETTIISLSLSKIFPQNFPSFFSSTRKNKRVNF